MKNFTLILLLALPLFTCAQSVRLPSGDSITYDFSGATRKGSPGLYKYFTTNINDDGRITREVADFNRDSIKPLGNGKGWRGMINFQKEYILDSIKYYDRSGSVDTIWIYTFDKNNAPKWDTICNPEDHTPDYILISCGTCAGLPQLRKINAIANDTVQFAYVVFRRTNVFAFGRWLKLWPDVSNISFYGRSSNRAAGQDSIYNLAHWAFRQWTAKTIDSIDGHFNLVNQQDTTWSDTALYAYGKQRNFDQMFFYDYYTKRLNLGGTGYTAYKYNAAMARRKHFQFAAVFNNNNYFNFQLDSMHHYVEKGWGTNTVYDDPQKPSSYSEKGRYMHGLSWIGGGCASCTGIGTYNGTPVAGQGYLKKLGTTNEATLFAFPNAWKTPIEVAAESIGVYDSIKLGDPNMPVIVGAFEAYNYDDAKAVIMLMKLYSRSRNIKADGLDFHAIHTLRSDSFQVIPTGQQQLGNHGVSPGFTDDWRKNIHYVQGVRRELGNPNFKVLLSEDTHQKGVYKRYPSIDGENISQLGTPRYRVAGVTRNAYQSHGIGLLQNEAFASASPLDEHYHYQVVDDKIWTDSVDNGDGTYDAIDQSNGKFSRPVSFGARPLSWPGDYLSVSRKLRVGRYRFVDTVQAVKGGLYVFKYQHINNPDSLMFEFFVGDSVATATYVLNGLNANSGKLITPSFTSRSASQAMAQIKKGAYTLNADPLPRQLIVYSPPGSVAATQKSKPHVQSPVVSNALSFLFGYLNYGRVLRH